MPHLLKSKARLNMPVKVPAEANRDFLRDLGMLSWGSGKRIQLYKVENKVGLTVIHTPYLLVMTGHLSFLCPTFWCLWPHWKKKSCLGLHIKYIATHNHTKNLIMF